MIVKADGTIVRQCEGGEILPYDTISQAINGWLGGHRIRGMDAPGGQFYFMYVDDNGISKGLPKNEVMSSIYETAPVYGDAVVCLVGFDSESRELPDRDFVSFRCFAARYFPTEKAKNADI